MLGNQSTRPISRDLKEHRGLMLAVIAAGTLLLVGMLVMAVLEARFKKTDRHNQERISWTCNGNGVADCIPYRRA